MTMTRIQLTPEQQANVDAWRTSNNVQPGAVIVPDTNIVTDDQFRVFDGAFDVVVLGPSPNGPAVIPSYIPDWDYTFELDTSDLLAAITDRAGPNGETLPVYDEQQMQARAAAAKTSAQNPREAARAERREERAQRRDMKELVRDALKRLPKGPTRKAAREKLRAASVLGADDKDDD